MTHPLIEQLRFTRQEWKRGLIDVTGEEAQRRFGPMNAIGWMVGHLAWHEQLYWLERGQGRILVPELLAYANGQPASTPDPGPLWGAWQAVIDASDVYLDDLSIADLQRHYLVEGAPHPESIGTMINHMIYHYWYHLGETQAVRQLLGSADLPEFVGDITKAQYRPET